MTIARDGFHIPWNKYFNKKSSLPVGQSLTEPCYFFLRQAPIIRRMKLNFRLQASELGFWFHFKPPLPRSAIYVNAKFTAWRVYSQINENQGFEGLGESCLNTSITISLHTNDQRHKSCKLLFSSAYIFIFGFWCEGRYIHFESTVFYSSNMKKEFKNRGLPCIWDSPLETLSYFKLFNAYII